MKDLSSKQDQILEFLRSFIEDKDYPPSIRDIQDGCGISSTSVVDYNLRKLEEKGFIRRDREVSRGIEILGSRASYCSSSANFARPTSFPFTSYRVRNLSNDSPASSRAAV